jgi:anti-sigma-K factor RskA
LGTRSPPRSQLTNSKGNVMSITGWGVLLVVAVAVVAAIVLIIRLIVRHTRGYD